MGFRITKQRTELLKKISEPDSVWTAASLHHVLPHIDLATIYRNLELFTREGIVKKLSFTDGETLYEYTNEPHQHAVCSKCAKIFHIDVPQAKLASLVPVHGFKVSSVEVVMHGECAKGH